MNSSSEAQVMRDADRVTPLVTSVLAPLATPELRTGNWTRFGSSAVLGDSVTEQTLSALAETTRAAALSQGYAVGWAEGRRAAAVEAAATAATAAAERVVEEARREAEHRAAVAALQAAAHEVRASLTGHVALVDATATDLAFALTEELVAHQVGTGSAGDVVRRVLDVLPPDPTATVRLHPAALPAATQELTGITVVADPSLAPGDAVVETDSAAVDLRLGTALARIREALA